MNAEQILFGCFGEVVDVPHAVPRLRKFILDLAVCGRLVEQNPHDEPVSVLKTQIVCGKAKLIESGTIRTPRAFPEVAGLECLFAIPSTWCWRRLDEIGAIVGGGTPSTSNPENFVESGEGIPWLTPADLGKYRGIYVQRGSRDLSEVGLKSSSATLMPEGAVLFSSRAPIGYVAIASNPISTNQGFKSIVPYVVECSRFIALVMKSIATYIEARASGTTFKEAPGKLIAGLAFPLPPLAEQHRIVAKVDELMEQCDQLEAEFQERDNHRKQFTKASFASLTESGLGSGEFRKRSEFVVGNFDCLSVDVNQITRLRQLILDLAIRGKLVEQNQDDESAEELLIQVARIQSRKQSRELTDLASEYQNFALPAQWIWVPATYPANVVSSHGKQIKTKDILKSGKFPVVDQGKVPIRGFCDDDQKVIRVVDPLILFGDHTRAIKFIDFDFVVGADGVKILEPIGIDERFYFFVLQWLPLESKGYSRHFKQLKASYIPFPPLAEQHRIVAKVDELMEQCNHLEERIRLKETLQSRSFCSVLARSLTDQLIG